MQFHQSVCLSQESSDKLWGRKQRFQTSSQEEETAQDEKIGLRYSN
jgi:hypothetical protein